MKKIGTFAMFTISLLLCTISFGQEQVPAPVFQDGDLWQFKVVEKGFLGYSSEAGNATYELAYSGGEIKIFRVVGDQKTEVDRKPPFPLPALLGLSKEYVDLRFPLSAGQKWSYEYRFTPAGAKRENRVSAQVTANAFEDVTTAAGTFRALRMQKDETWPRPGGGQARQLTTYFYSPQTRSVVKSSMENVDGARREIELIKFGSAPK
jgi:hypothetical protein